jgi:hypothetical protein
MDCSAVSYFTLYIYRFTSKQAFPAVKENIYLLAQPHAKSVLQVRVFGKTAELIVL